MKLERAASLRSASQPSIPPQEIQHWQTVWLSMHPVMRNGFTSIPLIERWSRSRTPQIRKIGTWRFAEHKSKPTAALRGGLRWRQNRCRNPVGKPDLHPNHRIFDRSGTLRPWKTEYTRILRSSRFERVVRLQWSNPRSDTKRSDVCVADRWGTTPSSKFSTTPMACSPYDWIA